MVSSDDVATSKAIQQRTGKTFHVATRVLPERVREATYVLYAFFRVADEVVDDPQGAPPDAQRAELERIRAAALGERDTDDPVLRAFHELKESYGIPDEEVDTFIDAMEMDVDTRRYDTHEDLAAYLRGSAVSVGYMMLDVMAGRGEMTDAEVRAARPHAKALGEAFQLSNFLRDVREDVEDYGRIYLPMETLERHDVPVEEIENYDYSDRFAAAMCEEVERTEELYREGVEGIRYLPEDCQFAVLVSAVLYADHHRLIRNHDYDTLSARRTLSTPRRLSLLARTWYYWQWTDDPAAAFHAASVVPESAAQADEEEAGRGRPRLCPVGRSAGKVRAGARRFAGGLLSLMGGITE